MPSEDLERLKQILRQEISDIRRAIEDNQRQDFDELGGAFSRTADRNDLIRINTLRWVLDVIDTLDSS
ncbi:hypothetical protein NTE_02037 [Candidatus Nitrososphaera evergladensis SR1]|uniref:Uncharacterized protein n=1 Tax=Candidatus Nitrososphaera evergladensis SR1 TaxID=1459636 RepID=A0A075MXS1_9ARCH|nr:hypothetical protein [Candidatus Nitrososphaera evergladensis]AIF84094.1 hypothetical protein NTE_02037 [Candidatus Nitrososphaera evergladensis SR1]